MSDSVLFYRSFYEAIKDIPDEHEQLALVKAVCEYAFDDIEPQITGIIAGMFKLIKPQIDANAKRRQDGNKGGRPKAETSGYEDEKPVVTKSKTSGYEDEKPNDNVNDNANVNVNDNANVGKKRTRFAPPTAEDIKKYCIESGHNIDAEAFIDFYTSKGWKIGKEPMKDWKSAVRNWERRDKERASPGKAPPKSDFDDVYARLHKATEKNLENFVDDGRFN